MARIGRSLDWEVIDEFQEDAHSIGSLHGSARGQRNIVGRLAAMARLAPLKGGRLLDIGCGTGEYTTEMARHFDAVDAIDIEPERLELFAERARANTTVTAMSGNNLKFDDESFDLVSMIEVLEHLSDPVATMKEIRRVLKPGAYLLLTTPNRYWPIEQHGVLVGGSRFPGTFAPGLVWIKPLHRRLSDADAFSKRDLAALASRAELQLVDVTYMMPPLDSLGEGSRVHEALDKLETSVLSMFGQTIVGAFQRPVC